MTASTTQWEDIVIRTVDDILPVIAELSKNYSWVYRGQPDASWSLSPSLHRLFPPEFNRIRMATWEAASISNFRRHAQVHLSDSQAKFLSTILGSLTLMQHYGAPTRLLDWTSSPWVAAYFAVAEYPDKDGSIWTFDRDYLSRDNPFGVKDSDADGPYHLGQFNQLTGATTVAEWSRHSSLESPAFSTLIYEFADQRISAQQSLFTLAGSLGADHGKELARLLPGKQRFRIIVPAALKHELMLLLWRMNVGPLSLFPGIEGVGRFVTDSIRNHFDVEDGGISWILRNTDDGRELGLE